MSDYGTMQERIADEASASGLTPQIQKAIQTAIDFYSSRRFSFNESDVTFATVGSQSAYGSADNPDIPNIKKVLGAKIGQSGWSCRLSPVGYGTILPYLDLTGGVLPEIYAYHNSQIHLAPLPAAGYTATFACVIKLDTLSADTDTNAWMTDGEALIRHAAKSYLFNDVMRQYEDGIRAEAAAMREFRMLQNARSQLTGRATARLADIAARGTYNITGDTY